MIVPSIVFGGILLLFALLGVVFARGKGQGLIAGYNTLSEKERAKIDEERLMKVMSRGMFALAGCMALGLIGFLTSRRELVIGCFILFAAVIVLILIFANTKTKR